MKLHSYSEFVNEAKMSDLLAISGLAAIILGNLKRRLTIKKKLKKIKDSDEKKKAQKELVNMKTKHLGKEQELKNLIEYYRVNKDSMSDVQRIKIEKMIGDYTEERSKIEKALGI